MEPELQLIFSTRKKARVIVIALVTFSSDSDAHSICNNIC